MAECSDHTGIPSFLWMTLCLGTCHLFEWNWQRVEPGVVEFKEMINQTLEKWLTPSKGSAGHAGLDVSRASGKHGGFVTLAVPTVGPYWL